MTRQKLTLTESSVLRRTLLAIMRKHGICADLSDDEAADVGMELVEAGFLELRYDPRSDGIEVRVK